MGASLARRWQAFKRLPAGERFARVHERQRGAPVWVKVLLIAGAVLSFGIGILLSVLPGPAFVFYGLAGALLGVVSAPVARALDRTELMLRRWMRRLRQWRAQRRRVRQRRAIADRS